MEFFVKVTLISLFCVVKGDVYSSMDGVQPALLQDNTLNVATCYQNYHDPPPGYDYQLCPFPAPKPSIFFSFAIHGGKIETQSTEVTLDMSTDPNNNGEVWNTYYFEGLRPNNNSALHVTATHFDDPTILSMIYNTSSIQQQEGQSDKWCVSNHGFSWHEPEVCVGGASQTLRDNTVAALSAKYGHFVEVLDTSKSSYCSSIAGLSPQNVVNLCYQGLQLEMSSGLRDEFAKDHQFRLDWSQTVRKTVMETAESQKRM
uniref:Uncharacterized protein n=1 Tax=Paramoeba aestuarina TaxID=180227 RepID=A0A7S4NQN2_9EUKA|mmetsp:Transcript_24128/g.37600  ORF Transcript_24128/g.37600 Transcript_24128/m.37600 type:complete len:258 (+) Transcript_24128:73-846(+)|eukprot:CAMPEP_0201515320 /NCGR_PEP_ID=MMETSP0161_2-20130828/6919_1 /ASSEMBLY_ACC=CAM_ASM_000251 /TAXON_ID=180227 /ORGANISM="Neoparamoeba aestuarina, Strain SoJaBio B1-5/56/2" /LENGTH=257 /DNA_ID=CAMNT_0047912117 /DNA_START=55 /DNA_END=828 /DNA_ORIENTATION=+